MQSTIGEEKKLYDDDDDEKEDSNNSNFRSGPKNISYTSQFCILNSESKQGMFSFLYLFLVFLVFVALCFIMGTWIIH
jgi:hypothetical protein